MSERIGLFGGTFNPIHHGHLIIARSVRERLELDRLVFIPSAKPPHKQDERLAPAEARLAMVRLAVEGEPGFNVDDVEIRREGPSYTVLTVEAYHQRAGTSVELFWLIGGDTLPELATWYRIEDLVGMCRFVTAVRPGFESPDLTSLMERLPLPRVRQLESDILETPCIDISSTEIRRRIADGRSIRYLVPERVRDYVDEQGLY